MKKLLLVAVLASVCVPTGARAQTPAPSAAPQGDAANGRRLYSGQAGGAFCMLCHGFNADGGFGPELAGRSLSYEQLVRAVKQPWGIMPTFPYLKDQQLADIYAFISSAPKPAQPGKWRIPMPPDGGPVVQRQFVSMSCGQCHGEELIHPRRDLGRRGNSVTFDEFKTIVYKTAPASMGIFNPDRYTEPFLRDVFKFMMDEGLRVPVSALIEATATPGTYNLTVWNDGIVGRGLVANDVTISIAIPAGTTVANTTGPNYQGVAKGAAGASDMMVWKQAKNGPGDKQVYTFTLTGTVPAQGAFRGSSVGWASPGSTRIPGLTYRDNRVPEKGDVIVGPGLEFLINLAPPKPPAQ